MNSTNRIIGLWRYALCAIATGLLACNAHAQQSTRDSELMSPAERLQEIRELLLALDSQASNCLNTPPAATAANPYCQSLIAAIDGEEVASYLQHCAQLQDWRDRFIDRYQDGATSGEVTDTTALEVLVQTEYWCGEDALRERTSSVFPAFAALNQTSGDNRSAGSTTNARAGSPALKTRTSGMRSMQERLRLETERLWLDLRIENLRQQLP